ncbi:MAG: hypothetical protein ACOYMF_09300 [Bacteroidales bacterium]
MNKEQYEKRNNELKALWGSLKKPEDIGFVWDGIIDYDKWISYDLKLAFMLREAYSEKDGEWDFAEGYNEAKGRFYIGGRGQQATFNRIEEWSYALDCAMHQREKPMREEVALKDYEASRKIMLASAYLNLKKIGGRSSSNIGELRAIANRDKELLLQQLKLISPNIILFCATYGDVLKNILFEGAIKIPETERCYESEGILLIDFFHPTRAYKGSFDFLFDDVSKIKNKAKYLK